MGKAAGDSPTDSAGAGGGDGSRQLALGEGERGRRRRWWRCAAAVLLGAAVVLSALFWLPPFARRRGVAREDRWGGADVVASFRLQRMFSELSENKPKLEYDIFEEIGIGNSTVSVISFDPSSESNWTTVTFAIWPYPSNSTISTTELSILRSYLMSLVIQQSTLQLTPSLFGNSSSFEILRFPSGITIIPPQNAFAAQKPDALFNFSLNFPIDVVQNKLSELKAQMNSGLFLSPREILYITLTNLDGSTVDPPTIVQTSVLLAVGADRKPPSLQRLKQHIAPVASPNSYEASGPYVDPPSFHPRIPSSPLPTVVFHAMSPTESVGTLKPHNKLSSTLPAPSTSSASGIFPHWWFVTSLVYLGMRLL
ncbi:hypothetical protein GUJ93_ZPchr0013g36666 [Zizania palustris]|uniref:DUF7036 domain-containing protein n=1 Tax=Zizania palustris TaxID=103762 RepID=A0A8J5WW89_ZIZPA|nr:hypothetical protein GUJ93_ZPchr0013g36666 [Zizania palustris]